MNIPSGSKDPPVSKVAAVQKKAKAKGEQKQSYSSLTEYQALLLEKQLIDSENESQSYDSHEEGLETEMDQEEDIYVTPKASSVKNGKSPSTMQKQVASQGQEKEMLQDHIVSKSGKKTAQQRPSERMSMQLAGKKSLQAVMPTPAKAPRNNVKLPKICPLFCLIEWKS